MNKSTKGLSLPVFLEFVEMKTKVASVFPMTLGILWSLYRYQAFNWLNTLLFIIAVLSFDMCTTAINNSMDYHKAKDETYRQESNVIGKFSRFPSDDWNRPCPTCFFSTGFITPCMADQLAPPTDGSSLFPHWYLLYLWTYSTFENATG